MVGYRSETLFGSGEIDPKEVSFFETRDLGNSDIPQYILNFHRENLDDKEIEYLTEIILHSAIPDFEIDKQYFQGIIEKVVKGRNYCKWLCESPEDVYDSYVNYPGAHNKVEYAEFVETVTAYDVPEDAIILTDLGTEGALYCWRVKDLEVA